MPAKQKERPPMDTSDWTVVRPDQHYADVWNREALDKVRMDAYKEMESENQIWIDKITYDKGTGKVVVEYRSTVPHEWILDELRKRVAEREKPQFTSVEQLAML